MRAYRDRMSLSATNPEALRQSKMTLVQKDHQPQLMVGMKTSKKSKIVNRRLAQRALVEIARTSSG